MAAGKVNVLRRGDVSCFSREDFRVKDGLGFEDVVERRSGGKGVLDGPWRARDYEGDDDDDGVVLSPPEKRRKVSSNLSDVRETDASFLLTQDRYFSDDKEPGQLDEDDFSRAPNISTSRWACDDSDDDCHEEKGGVGLKVVEEMKGTRSSPESGVTQKESSDGSGCYSEDECPRRDLENDDSMEVDVSDDGDFFASDSDSDAEDVSKPTIPELGKRNMLQGSRSVFEYERLGKINEGSYGIVYKARDKKTGEMVALKKLKMGNEKEGFPLYYLREINTLLAFDHPSIVNVREVVVDDSFDGFDNIYLVMDYIEHDLKALMQAKKQPFSQSEVKCLMLQLLEGIKYLHDNWVLHRDLKTANLLLNNKGELKICDFGMSRQYGSPLKPYTSLVVTLWYRAPELLLGAKEYSTAVDMWSVGCIMAELLTNKPLFDGKTELEQLNKIFRTLGTPNDKIWPGYCKLPGSKANYVHQPYYQLHKKFPRASFIGSPVLSDLGLDLLSKLLTYDPEKRITVDEALNHRWFQEVPLPISKDFMPTFPAEKVAFAR